MAQSYRFSYLHCDACAHVQVLRHAVADRIAGFVAAGEEIPDHLRYYVRSLAAACWLVSMSLLSPLSFLL
jgi:hypothetical protein